MEKQTIADLMENTKPVYPDLGLPDKPSALIRAALEDLEKCEADPAYEIEMCTWHTPIKYGGVQCTVCLAGAVMAKRDNVPASENCYPFYFPRDTYCKLEAINHFRRGECDLALARLGIEAPDFPPDYSVVPYATNRGFFKSNMRALASLLEQFGL